ncbi:MAG: bifunctional riboflavin kinase/FMN adenylyltransferase [Bacteroidales bacterium]|nr:bifunctional riboflavin kinase/FMN adenylyltransferase [Bacteroidales bacterium]
MAVVTTGFFDGVHLGHRHVLSAVVSSARERGEEAVVVTFWPHPRTVLQQDAREFRILTTLEEKKALLAAAGIDRVEVLPFTRAFAAMTAEEYLEMLRDRFGASLVVMGYDNRIGSDRLTIDALTGAFESRKPSSLRSSSLPTSLLAVGPLPFTWPRAAMVSGDPNAPVISSTKIRNALQEGRVEDANAMLGYGYELYGVVVAGNRLGRTIGFPTANMQLYEPLKLVPGNGVYVVDVEVLGRQFRGMCNIGMRPTVGGAARTIETHILDFDEDIYGLPLRLRFVRRLRDERKFPSLEALQTQLAQDALNCKK